jgi:hypothetical protein
LLRPAVSKAAQRGNANFRLSPLICHSSCMRLIPIRGTNSWMEIVQVGPRNSPNGFYSPHLVGRPCQKTTVSKQGCTTPSLCDREMPGPRFARQVERHSLQTVPRQNSSTHPSWVYVSTARFPRYPVLLCYLLVVTIAVG